jgi:hypothetical protein
VRPPRIVVAATAAIVVVLGSVGAALGILIAVERPDGPGHDLPRQVVLGDQHGQRLVLLATLRPLVRHDFPASTCEDYVRELHLPNARFTVLGVGSPVTFRYRVAGIARFSVPGAVPVRLEETAGASSSRTTMHLVRGPDGSYRWFGNCSVAPS